MAKAKDGNGDQVTSLTVKTVRTWLESTSPYSQSKAFQSVRKENEAHDAFDERCWRERCNTAPDGRIMIPPMAFKQALVSAAKLMNEKIPGKRNQTWAKQFECGVLIGDGITLDVRPEDISGERLFVPSDGKKGGGSRVYRRFPLIPQWSGVLIWYVTAPEIIKSVFQRYVEAAGLMIGLGRFRVERGGCYGRYRMTKIEWPE